MWFYLRESSSPRKAGATSTTKDPGVIGEHLAIHNQEHGDGRTLTKNMSSGAPRMAGKKSIQATFCPYTRNNNRPRRRWGFALDRLYAA